MIPPGKAGNVRATLDTKGLRGEISKTIALRTNDPIRPAKTLAIKARLIGSVLLLPRPELAVHLRPAAAPGRLVVRKDPSEHGPLAITDVKSSAPWLTATARRVESAQPAASGLPALRPGDWILEVSTQGGRPSMTETVSFRTGLPREPRVEVPVRVVGRPAISVSAAEVVLPPPTAAGDSSRAEVLVTVRPGVDPATLVAEAAPSGFRSELEQSGTRHFRVRVFRDPGGPSVGTLILRVAQERIEVPIRVGSPGS